MKIIPIYIEAGISCFESPAIAFQELGLSLDELLINQPSSTYIGIAKGYSMTDVGIFNGDLLIINRAVSAENGDVIVGNYNGCFTCKIINTEQAKLVSASTDYKNIYITEFDDFRIEGVVMQSIRMHRKVRELVTCMP